jgi:hypothetical protein
MLTDREKRKAEISEAATKAVVVARARWLKQLLDWPLRDGPLVNRLTKAEITALEKAAKQGELFC